MGFERCGRRKDQDHEIFLADQKIGKSRLHQHHPEYLWKEVGGFLYILRPLSRLSRERTRRKIGAKAFPILFESFAAARKHVAAAFERAIRSWRPRFNVYEASQSRDPSVLEVAAVARVPNEWVDLCFPSSRLEGADDPTRTANLCQPMSRALLGGTRSFHEVPEREREDCQL